MRELIVCVSVCRGPERWLGKSCSRREALLDIYGQGQEGKALGRSFSKLPILRLKTKTQTNCSHENKVAFYLTDR